MSGRRVTPYSYDSGGNLVGQVDPLGRRTTIAYDVLNRATTVTDPLVRDTKVAFDAAGRATTLTNANGEATVLAYDAGDRLTTAVRQGSGTVLATTVYSYSAGDDLLVRTDPNGNRVTLAYDALHRLTTIAAPLSRTTVLAYDAVGNVTARTDPNTNRVTYAYDAADRLTTITAPLSRVATLAYDAADRLVEATDPLGLRTTYAYDKADRLTTLTNPRGDVTKLAYDQVGNLTELTDPNGNRTTYAYDAADRVTTATDALGTATYAYDAADQLTDRTDRLGRRVTHGYDSGGRMTNERWLSGGSTVRQLTYSYDFVGRLTGAADPDATLTFAYDNGGRLTTAVTAGPGGGQTALTLTYAFDAGDRRTGLVDTVASNVGRTTYQYDAADRLTTVTRSHNGVAGPRVVLGYDAGDRLTAINRTINGAGTAVSTTLAYDAADRLTTLTHQVAGGASLATYAYAYDKNDRLTTETINGSAVTYTYDNAGQLTAAGGARTETYGFDPGGNRNTAGYTNTTGNRQTAAPGVTYTYDAEGNVAAQTVTNGAGTGDDVVTTYSYDHRNRLTGVTRRAAGGVGAAVAFQATYAYDALDRRIGAKVDADGAGAGAPVQRWTAYDGANPYADFDGSNALTNRYLHGPAVDFLLSRTSAAGTTAWYLPDRLGSVRNVADVAGSLTYTATYDSFGKVLSESGAGGDRFKYTGREYEAGAAIYDYRARAYDPATGRFLQRDPIGFAGGDANLHRYVANSPTNATDPSGLIEVTDITGTIGEIGSFFPIAGEIADAGQIILGHDLYGNKLSTADKVMTAVGFALPFVPGSVARRVLRPLAPLAADLGGRVARGARSAGRYIGSKVDEAGGLVRDAIAGRPSTLMPPPPQGPMQAPAVPAGAKPPNKPEYEYAEAKPPRATAESSDPPPRRPSGDPYRDSQPESPAVEPSGPGGPSSVPPSEPTAPPSRPAATPGDLNRKSPKGLLGVDFENWLRETLGGTPAFKLDGREFDGALTPERWYEAKSGQYWERFAQPGPGFDTFRSDIGARRKIASNHGASYEVHSNTPIPQHVKDWLSNRGIPFFEHLE